MSRPSSSSSSSRRSVPASPDDRREEHAKLESGVRTLNRRSLETVPPQHLEAEMGVLGSAMLDPSCMDELFTLIEPDDFYSDANRQIFIAIRNVHAAGRRVDSTLIHDRLKRSNMLEFVGGVAYLIEITEAVCHAANFRYYADLVKDCAMRRRIMTASLDAFNRSLDMTTDAKQLAVETETAIGDIGAARDAGELALLTDVVGERFRKITAKKEPKRGLKSGIYALDKLFDGYECGHMNIIAARTSVGKTALATSHITHWLRNTEAVGYFCSLEMTKEEVVERILVNDASIDLFRFRNHYLQGDEIERLRESVAFLQNGKLFIDDAPERTVPQIMAMARRVKRLAGRLDYVLIDYIQLIEGEDRFAKRHEQVAKISRKLKNGAKALDCPIIALAQLNREADGEKPKLSHLRESGSLEQDADKVVFIHRTTGDNEAENSRAELIVAKNRHGKIGNCFAAFFGSYQRFQGMAEDVAF